jgi:integrase/recombinase XerD
MSFSVYHYLWIQRKLKDNTYPIKLVVNIDGDRKLYQTKYSLTKADWQRLNGSRLRDVDLGNIKDDLIKQVKEVKKILNDIEIPTHPSFEERYNQRRLKKNQYVKYWYDRYIEKQEKLNKSYSSIRALNSSVNSLQSFKPNLKFKHITKKFLEEYETWMLKNNPNSQTTISIYLTRLRIIFNYAIHEEKVIPSELYPFGKKGGGFIIKHKKGKKPALNYNQVKSLFRYKCESKEIEFSRDIWIISYLLNGMNVIDLCRLRYKDLDFKNDTFSYNRSKTSGTKTISTTIEGGLHPVAKKIINKYGNKVKDSNNYVFPFLNQLKGQESNNRKEEYHIKNDLLKLINNGLKPFQEILNLSFKLTFESARHSYASVLLYDKKYQKEVIGEGMGHSSVDVTEHYFAGTDIELKKKMNKDLLPLK